MAAPLPSRGNLPDNARPLVARTPRPPKPSNNGHHANGQASPPNVKSRDPARGIKGAPPGFGMPVMPHVMTFQGLISNLAKVYRNPDEAYRHSKDNARYMRNDCTVMECLEARQRCVALLNWHLEPEDENSPLQKKLVDDLTAIIRRTSRFVEYRRSLQEAVWFGRSAINNLFNWDYVHGQQRLIVRKWRPINGDKLLFRQDIPGVNEEGWDPDQIGIRVAGNFKPGDLVGPHKVVATDQGMGYFLEDWERRAIVLHKHMVEDAAYESPIDAGAIHGVGVRSRIYWAWYQKQEALAMLVEYLERVGQGFTIWYYPLGNPEGKAKAEAAAMESHQNNNILVPIPEGEEKSQYGIDRIEPNAAGVESLKSIVHDLFGHQIKRYILGQILSSESEATGLGSGVADLHLETFNQIIRYDATNLEESLTTDFVEPLKLFNFPGSQRVYVRFVIDTESPEVEKKLQAYHMAWEMGLKLKPAEVAGMIGSSIPTDGEEVLQNPTFSQGAGMGLDFPGIPGQQPGQPGQPGDNLPGSRSTVAFPQNPLAGGDDEEPGEDDPEPDDDPDDDPDGPDDDGPEDGKQKAAADDDGGLQLRMYGPAGGAQPRQYAKRDDAESIIVEDDDPDIVATAIIHDGKVLLVRRSEASTRTGEWECPAGHRRDGEDPRKAAAREVQEETGLSIDWLPGSRGFLTRNGKAGIMYFAEVAAGASTSVETNPKEHDDFWWLDLDDLEQLDWTDTPPNLRGQLESIDYAKPSKGQKSFEFREEDHPRDDEGKFVAKDEESGTNTEATTAPDKPKTETAPGPTPEPAKPARNPAELWKSARHELTEDEYLEQSLRSRIESREKLLEMGPRNKPTSERDRKLIEEAMERSRYELERLKTSGLTDGEKHALTQQYFETVKQAIKQNLKVPDKVLDQRPEFRKAQDNWERYRKGWHTSFANKSIAVDARMQQARGFKAKRQDGKPISNAQVTEIAVGLDEIEKAIGPLRDVLLASDVTIAHTNGKHPFLSDAGGMYHNNERTITTGVAIRGKSTPSLAHELGHWLDIEAGSKLGKSVRVGKTTFRPSTSLAESQQRYGGDALIERARFLMQDKREARELAKAKKSKAETDDERDQIEWASIKLGPYWYEPREIWARLFEQYVSFKLGGNVGVSAQSSYAKHPAYWSDAEFAGLVPDMEKAIEHRLKVLREPKPTPDDSEDKEKHQRQGQRRRYRAEPDDSKASPKGAQWKTVGGAPALVGEDGHIHAGCPGLEGEDVDDLRDESDESRARRARKQDAHEDHRDSVLREAHDRALEMAPAGTILLVNENGDYHAFGAGAARLNEHLELGNGKHAVIKQADLEGHLNTLVNRGHRVGIVDAPGHATPHREDDDHQGYPDEWDDIDMVGDEEPTPQEQPETGEQTESPAETEIDAPTQPDPAKADAARRARAELEQSKEAIRRAWRQAGQNPPDELLPKQEASVRELESAAGLPPGGEPKSQPQSQQQPAKQPKPKRTPEGRLGQAISALAEEHNLDAATLRDAVDFVWEEKRQAITDREHAKMQLREIMGLTRNDFARLSNAGKDYTAIPGFDVKATSVAASLPELGLGNHAEGYSEDLGERVWDMLGEGRIEPPARWSNEVLSEAVDLAHQAGKYVPARDDAIESVPFARTRRFLRKYNKRWVEDDHPRDGSGKFTDGSGDDDGTGGDGKPAKKPAPSRSKKLTILQAADKLAEKGYTLEGAEPYDLKNKSARYRVKHPDGTVSVMTPDDIHAIISRK